MTKVNERGELKRATKEEVDAVLNADVKSRIAEYVEEQEELAAHIAETLGLESGVVLDVGCGQGFVDVALALRCPQLSFVLVDPSDLALEAAAANFDAYGYADRLTTMKGDEQDLPFDDGGFEWIISTTPGLWSNKQQGLEEIHRVLSVGGRAYVTEIEWDNYRDYFGMMMQAELAKFSVNKAGKRSWIDIFKCDDAGRKGDD